MPLVSGCALWSIYCYVFMETVHATFILPLLPAIGTAFGMTTLQMGMLTVVQNVAKMVSTPILGRLSDRFGRRPLILCSILGSVTGSILSGFTYDFYGLLGSRAIVGVVDASPQVGAYIADVTSHEERILYLNYIGGAVGVATLVGPAISALLVCMGFQAVFFFGAAVSAANFVFCLLVMPESRWLVPRPDADAELNSQAALQEPLIDAPTANAVMKPVFIPWEVYCCFVTNAMFTLGASASETMFGYYLRDEYLNGDIVQLTRLLGPGYIIVALCVLFTTLVLVPRSLSTIGRTNTLIVSAVIRFVSYMVLPGISNMWVFLVIFIIEIMGSTLGDAIPNSMISLLCGSDIQATVQGISNSFIAAARIVGPLLFGYVYPWNHSFSWYFCGGVGAVSHAFLIWLTWKKDAVLREP